MGREAGGAQFKADLVVALSGGTVGDGVRSFLEGDLEHALGDAGTGNGGAQEVAAFVDRVGLEHGKDEVAGELLPHVADEALAGPGVEGLFLESVQFVPLADVCAEGDDVRAVGLLQPGEQDGGVQSSGIGNDDFHGRGS